MAGDSKGLNSYDGDNQSRVTFFGPHFSIETHLDLMAMPSNLGADIRNSFQLLPPSSQIAWHRN